MTRRGPNILNQRRFRPYIAIVDQPGLEVTDVGHTGSGHVRLDLTYQGNTKAFVLSHTPSDHRATKNFKATLQRWMREVDGSEDE